MVDLHTHTNCSDGSMAPHELVDSAVELGLEALAITDHDTFAGYEQAAPYASTRGLDLICGIELSTKFRGKTTHLLGYFLGGTPSEDFRSWIQNLQDSRHARNRDLLANLAAAGIHISMDDLAKRGGSLPGRPHVAALLVERGYVASISEAFERYLGEGADCYANRIEPSIEEGIQRITDGGGIPSLPHPFRTIPDRTELASAVEIMRAAGLLGIEVHHSDHSAGDREYLQQLAERHSLLVTGGTDFHGTLKPRVALGTGIGGNVNVSSLLLRALRQQFLTPLH